MRTGRRGFTLLELLAVVVIIGVLCAILLPTLGKARDRAKRVACGQVLHGLSVGFQAYLTEFERYYPVAAQMPSVNVTLPALPAALEQEVQGANGWRCPADTNGYLRADGVAFDSYFAGETLSYEYNMTLGGHRLEKDFLYPILGASGVYVVLDFDWVHDAEGKPTSKNILFGDGHVGDIGDLAKLTGG